MAMARETNIMADVALLPYVVVVRAAYPCVRESSANACNEEESDANGRSTAEVNGAWWEGFCVAIILASSRVPAKCSLYESEECIVQTPYANTIWGTIYNL